MYVCMNVCMYVCSRSECETIKSCASFQFDSLEKLHHQKYALQKKAMWSSEGDAVHIKTYTKSQENLYMPFIFGAMLEN